MNTISSLQSDFKPRDEFSTLAVIDDEALEKISGGLIGPDQDLNDFPRWLWPVIRTAKYTLAEPDPAPWLGANQLKASLANVVN